MGVHMAARRAPLRLPHKPAPYYSTSPKCRAAAAAMSQLWVCIAGGRRGGGGRRGEEERYMSYK